MHNKKAQIESAVRLASDMFLSVYIIFDTIAALCYKCIVISNNLITCDTFLNNTGEIFYFTSIEEYIAGAI